MSGEIPRDIQVNKILKCFIFLKKMTMQQSCQMFSGYILYHLSSDNKLPSHLVVWKELFRPNSLFACGTGQPKLQSANACMEM